MYLKGRHIRPGKNAGQTLRQIRVGRGESEGSTSMCFPTDYPLCLNKGLQEHSFSEARDWNISVLVWYWVNLTKLELYFSELVSLYGSRLGLPTTDICGEVRR